ncbi:MAG: serine/threonine-protein kinase [Kofleriaceae bacterium]|nr:serine/threonine-protein kinase [Kofleriaceae bacterium]
MACPEPRAFSDFVEGRLDAAARGALELHVDTCESCRIALSETGRARRRSRSEGARAEEVPRLPEAGDVVGRYTIVGRLGEGAMGVVYLARDPELDREIAIKVVQPRLGEPEQELVQQRMLREGRLLARIDHANVVRVFDVGRWRGAVFVALERVHGESLRGWLAREKRSAREIVTVFRQCAAGLAAAHAAGVIHRDVKPDNVIVDDAGHARVSDFGLARIASDEVGVEPDALDAGSVDVQLTRTRGTVGTPAYMAPELHLGGAADERSDQFALCTALAEALSGQRPFAGDEEKTVVEAMRAERPVLGVMPRHVRKVVMRGLAFAPAARWPSMAALAEALAERPRVGRWIAGGVLVVAGVIGVVATRGTASNPCEGVTDGMRATWSAERRAQIATVFANTKQAFADASWSYAREAIDAHVARWGAARIEVCRAGMQRGELDAATRAATVRCLERQRLGLDALLARWSRREGEALALAAQAVDGLGAPDACAAEAVGERALTAEEEGRARAVAARLAEAIADADVGRVKEAVATLRRLAHELGAVPALHAEVLVELAGQERALGQGEAARADLVTAIATAERAGAERVKARGWIALAEVAGDDGVRLPEARDALGLASAVIERLGEPAALRSQHDVAAAVVALRGGDHVTAIAAVERSLVKAGELAVSERTRRRQILARARIAGGDIAGALAVLELAERDITAALGPDAPALVYVLNSMIEPLDYLGRAQEAIARGTRALAIFDASFGVGNTRRAKLLGNLASVYANAGALDKALAMMNEQVATLRDAETHEAAVAHTNFASTLLDAKRPAEALPHLARAQAIFTAQLGATHPLLANVHASAARARLLVGDAAKGVEHARAALAIREQSQVGVGYVAFSRFVLAQALTEAGQRAEGIAMAKHALEPVDGVALATTGREGELFADIQAFLVEQAKQR